MGISYDSSSKKWNIVYEKTDNPTNLPANTPLITSVNLGPTFGVRPLRSLEAIQNDINNFPAGSRSYFEMSKNLSEYRATVDAISRNEAIQKRIWRE